MTRYKEEIHLLRAENKTYKQIAQELGIHRSTVHRALKPDSYELQKKKSVLIIKSTTPGQEAERLIVLHVQER